MADKDFESTGGINPDEFTADLFPSSESPGPSDGGLEAVSSPDRTTPPGDSTPPPEAGITQETWDALPKSWKKEMEAEWKTASPALRRYAHEREGQVTAGITQYRSGHDSWAKATAPFAEVMKQYPDANPLEILSTLAQNHIRMIQATPEERREHALALARGYGVDLTATQQAAVNKVAEGASPDDFTPGQLKALQKLLDPVLEPVRQTTEFINRQQQTAAEAEVDKFFSDKKNEFANELGHDILQIMRMGQAQSLPEAYELAMLRNPEVKAKHFAKLAKEFAPAPATVSKLPNVKSSATPRKGSDKPATIDDTIAEVVHKHYG